METMRKCQVKINTEWVEVEFVGVFQYSKVIEPSLMVGGHSGGVIAYPIAVVKTESGLRNVGLSDVRFETYLH